MYFIPRNNALYQYIAYTNPTHRYIVMLFLVAGFGLMCFYGVYQPLSSHILLYKSELACLQQQHENMQYLERGAKELSAVIFEKKRQVNEHVLDADASEKECSKRMQFVFDTIAQSGLTLSSYGACTEKDKKWYTKEVSHCQITGSMEKLLLFLKAIQDSHQMIKLSHIAITRIKDDLFQLSVDVEILLVKQA